MAGRKERGGRRKERGRKGVARNSKNGEREAERETDRINIKESNLWVSFLR